MKNEDIQKHYMEFQFVDQQIKTLQQQLMMLEQQSAEIASLMDNLETLKNVKPNTSAFAEIGPGIAVETSITNAKHVVMNVGANTMVKKTIPEAQKTLQSQVEDIQNVTKNMEMEIQKLLSHAQYLREEIQKASKQ